MRRDYPMERSVLLQRVCRSAAVRRGALLAGIIFSIAGCADTPNRYNPIEWGKSAANEVGNLFGGEHTPPSAEPPPAEGRPYPNLATVPKPVRETPEAKERRAADLERLTRERDRALADDEILRATGTMPPPAPATPPPAEPAVVPATPTPASRPATTSAPAVSAVTVPVPAPQAATPALQASATPSAAAPVAVVAHRVGSVSFGRDAISLSPVAQRTLADAAAQARAGNGRVRLVAAQTAREAARVDTFQARSRAITQAVTAAGLSASNLAIDQASGRRVDLYDVYVER
jgi:hypothetical protein